TAQNEPRNRYNEELPTEPNTNFNCHDSYPEQSQYPGQPALLRDPYDYDTYTPIRHDSNYAEDGHTRRPLVGCDSSAHRWQQGEWKPRLLHEHRQHYEDIPYSQY